MSADNIKYWELDGRLAHMAATRNVSLREMIDRHMDILDDIEISEMSKIIKEQVQLIYKIYPHLKDVAIFPRKLMRNREVR